MDENIYVHVPVGPSGCGKSSLAIDLIQKYPDMMIVSKDKIREMFYGKYAYKHNFEDVVADAASYLLMCVLVAGNSVFLDETNLTVEQRSNLVAEANKFKKMSHRPVKVVCWYFKIGECFVDTLIEKRVRENKGVSGEGWKKIIMEQVERMAPPSREEGFDVVHVIDRDRSTDVSFAAVCYQRQVELAKKRKTVTFVPASGMCPKCKELVWTVENVARSYDSLVTGCPYCGYSFCE